MPLKNSSSLKPEISPWLRFLLVTALTLTGLLLLALSFLFSGTVPGAVVLVLGLVGIVLGVIMFVSNSHKLATIAVVFVALVWGIALLALQLLSGVTFSR